MYYLGQSGCNLYIYGNTKVLFVILLHSSVSKTYWMSERSYIAFLGLPEQIFVRLSVGFLAIELAKTLNRFEMAAV